MKFALVQHAVARQGAKTIGLDVFPWMRSSGRSNGTVHMMQHLRPVAHRGVVDHTRSSD